MSNIKKSKEEIFESVKGGLVISCQALSHEPLFSSYIMGRMAVAAQMAGAVGIRANTIVDIAEIKKNVDLPIIGIIKQVYEDEPNVYITPTEKEVDALVAEGVEIIAIDATNRLRAGGRTLDEIFTGLRAKYQDQIFMADCSTVADGLHAVEIGFDCLGTTLAGYTDETKGRKLPDAEMLAELLEKANVPIIAEGGIHYPEQLKAVMDLGIHCAVVGGAITRPLEIATRFINAIK